MLLKFLTEIWWDKIVVEKFFQKQIFECGHLLFNDTKSFLRLQISKLVFQA